MDIKDYTAANREAWNEVMPRHRAASKDYLDALFTQPGASVLHDPDFLRVLQDCGVDRQSFLHLCCNNGIELMSLKNSGAGRCVGLDISEEAIQDARERCRRYGIDCSFVCSDVFDLQTELLGGFDVVLLTAGCLGWIPDLDRFFAICRQYLKPGGVLLIHEIHPFSEMLPFDSAELGTQVAIVEPYFRAGPVVENTSLDYVGQTDYQAKTQYWFVHTLSALFTSLARHKLALETFIESPRDVSASHRKIAGLDQGIPLSMIIQAVKT